MLLNSGLNTIGRSGENSVQFNEVSVSRRHATLLIEDEGRAKLTDLGSTNGTFLNGQRIGSHKIQLLRDDDRIQFGSAIIVKYVRPDACDERFQRELFERAARDKLTTLYNRAYFHEQLANVSRCAAQEGKLLAS